MISLDQTQILIYLRHREPWLMIDSASDIIPGQHASAKKFIPPDAWFFQNHFPGNPIVPGVMQLEAMGQTAVLAINTLPGYADKTEILSKIENAYYFEEVKPNDLLIIDADIINFKRGVAKCSSTIKRNSKLVSKAIFTISIPEEMIKI